MTRTKQTLNFKNKPYILSAYSIGGEKEGQGPLRDWFDDCLRDDSYDESTWEKSESKMLKTAITESMRRANKTDEDIGAVLSGDLLNQLMSSSFMARDLKIPFLGIYGACSTMTESLMLGAVLTDGGYSDNVVIGASSHYCTAERQFRMPLEHGNQRPPSAQWTATAAGAMLLSCCLVGNCNSDMDCGFGVDLDCGEVQANSDGCVRELRNVRIESGTIGRVVDAGIKDANQMGSAMAPAAVDTILNHLQDTGRSLNYYDIVFTGDLGFIGKDIVKDLMIGAGVSEIDLGNIYDDCGAMIYEPQQDTHSGGSGCGCSASTFAGYVYKKMRRGEIDKALIISTGALLSTISPFQGESIPGIAHAISLEAE